MVGKNLPDKWFHWTDPVQLMVMANLFCTLEVQERSLPMLCFVTPRAAVQGLMLLWPRAFLGSEHITEVNCSLMSIFLLDYFLLAPEKCSKSKRGVGWIRQVSGSHPFAATALTQPCKGSLVQIPSLTRSVGVSTAGQRCRKPHGCAGGFQSQPKWNAGRGTFWIAASLLKMGACPRSAAWDWVLALHLPVLLE